MPLHFRCPCSAILNVPDGSAGMGGECPSCGRIVVVPDEALAVEGSDLAAKAPPAPEPEPAPETEAAPPEALPPEAPAEEAAAPADDASRMSQLAELMFLSSQAQESGDLDAAAGHLRKILAMAPDHEGARTRLAAIEAGAAPVAPAEAAPAGAGAPGDEAGPGWLADSDEPVAAPEKAAAPAPALEVPRPAQRAGPVVAPRRPGARRRRPSSRRLVAVRPQPRRDAARAREEVPKGGAGKKVFIAILVLLVLAGGGFAGVVFAAPHLLPKGVRTWLKSMGVPVKAKPRPTETGEAETGEAGGGEAETGEAEEADADAEAPVEASDEDTRRGRRPGRRRRPR